MAQTEELRYCEGGMATATLMSVDEFAALPEDGQMHELVEGELISMPPPHSLHARVLHRIFLPLANFARRERLGEAFAETGYQLGDQPPTVRQPDITFQSTERLAAQSNEGYFRGSAELVIEIVSPSDRAGDLDLKVRQYLGAGAMAVAVVYPATRTVWVHRAHGSPQVLSAGRSLEFPDILAGWSMPLAEIFAPLDEG